MADNIGILDADDVEVQVGTDDIGGVHYQKILIVGTDGLAITPSGVDANNNGTVTPVASPGVTHSALTFFREATASTNAVNVKASAGNVYAIRAFNDTSTKYYLRLYNLAAAPTPSSATGFVETLTIPHATGAGAGFVLAHPVPQGYSTGIAFCITGGPGDTDATSAATGVRVTILYK